jgi:hypothetical protein
MTKDRLSRLSPWVTSFFLPHGSLGVGERRFGQMVTQLYRLTRPIYQHAIGTFNILARANPSVLNRHKRGLQPWRCRLSTSHSPTFPTDGLQFSPKGTTQSQVIHPTITKEPEREQTLNLMSWSLHSISTVF